MKLISLLLLLPLTTLVSCQSTIDKAVQNTKYSAYELIGVEKRDLFKKEVKKVKRGQEDTEESFQDALERLQAIYGTSDGNLEKQYRTLNSAYEESKERVESVHSRVKQLETVSQDLFAEWRKEISEMDSASLRAKSSETLQVTQRKYQDFHKTLKKSESQMDPILKSLRDQVLYLKHNLNAQAITGLKGEAGKIQVDIEKLIKDMRVSILQAENFIKEM